jgi:lipopolysaccharide biosynthesis glycosyltransferase
MYTVAVITAIRTNPTLKPYLIFDGIRDSYTDSLEKLGVTIIDHTSSLRNEIISHYKAQSKVALGAFLRVDLPFICHSIGIKYEYILYTDTDVMFNDDVSALNDLKTETFLVSNEFEKIFKRGSINSGVMWLNWKNLLLSYDEFLNYIKNNFTNFVVFDQSAYNLFYYNLYEELDYHYNYKPYWGPAEGIKIIHFHGPKPENSADNPIFKSYPHLNTPFFRELRDQYNLIYNSSILSAHDLSNKFSSVWYSINYPEVVKSGIGPIEHYLKHGWIEGKNPSATFNTKKYLNRYPDVAAMGINPLVHYIEHGEREGRIPN